MNIRLLVRLFAAAAVVASMIWGCGGNSTAPKENQPPRIVDVIPRPEAVILGGTSQITVLASDPDQNPLTFQWAATGGAFTDPTAFRGEWIAPDSSGTFMITVMVTDGVDTVSASTEIIAGNGSLTVLSYPPRAAIVLDGRFTIETTPHTFDPLPPGFHQIAITNPYYIYTSSGEGRELTHGSSDTVSFVTGPTQSEAIRITGNDPNLFQDIGGIVFLRNGKGVVFAAQTATGTGLFTSELNPASGSGNGFPILSGVRVMEPLTISVNGSRIFYVNDGDSLMMADMLNPDDDGIVDGLENIRFLKRDAFGPSISSTDQLAYSTLPSVDPPSTPLFWSQVVDTTLDMDFLASTIAARLPAWNPLDPKLAFESGGVIITTGVFQGGLPRADTLAADGYNTAPAWGPFGATHVAMLHGPGVLDVSDIRLAAPGAPEPLTVHTGLTDPRYMAWSPVQRALAVSHRPGGSVEVVLVFGLPIP